MASPAESAIGRREHREHSGADFLNMGQRVCALSRGVRACALST